LELDDEAHLVRRAGVLVALSPTEYKLLRYLMRNAGRALSRAQILDHVWDYDFGGESSIVETFISSLRKKVEGDGARLIQTVRGVGYRLSAVTDG
jgi:two-component system OmpR family response regulator